MRGGKGRHHKTQDAYYDPLPHPIPPFHINVQRNNKRVASPVHTTYNSTRDSGENLSPTTNSFTLHPLSWAQSSTGVY